MLPVKSLPFCFTVWFGENRKPVPIIQEKIYLADLSTAILSHSVNIFCHENGDDDAGKFEKDSLLFFIHYVTVKFLQHNTTPEKRVCHCRTFLRFLSMHMRILLVFALRSGYQSLKTFVLHMKLQTISKKSSFTTLFGG